MSRYLIVVDMQKDFVDGSLGTKDTHPDNYLETQEGNNLPVPHCIKNTQGWELTGRLTDVPPLNIVMKTTACNGCDVAKISDVEGKEMCKNHAYVHYLKRCIDWRMNNQTN